MAEIVLENYIGKIRASDSSESNKIVLIGTSIHKKKLGTILF